MSGYLLVRGRCGVNTPDNPNLRKGEQRILPPHPPTIVWLLCCAFENFLPRWQAARRGGQP